MNGFIPDVYKKTTDKSLIEAIEGARDKAERVDKYNHPCMPDWWICGECFCTQFNNGYYHAYVLEKSAFYGVILRDYRISRDGKMIDTDKYYSVPTRADLEKWCAERNIEIHKTTI